jgi:putative DNA primase/helicase
VLSEREVEDYFARCGILPLATRGDWRDARCPWHDDKSRSFSFNVKAGSYICQAGCGSGGLEELSKKSGIPFWVEAKAEPVKKTISKIYDYKDEGGKLLYQCLRYEPKTFRQRCPDGKGGWTWTLNGTRRVLYRLPELVADTNADNFVYVVEGEKDVDALRALGLTATCNPMGAGNNKWLPDFNQHLAGRKVVILPDNDEPGRQHAQAISAALVPIAASVAIVKLPNLPDKGDVSDWIAAGGTMETLLELSDSWNGAGDSMSVPAAKALAPEIMPPWLSEDGIAMEFSRRGDDWRYVAKWNQWLRWNDAKWEQEETREIFEIVRKICREIDSKNPKADGKARGVDFSTVSSVEKFVRSDRKQATRSDAWDRNIWLINTPLGIIDLKTGECRPSDKNEMMTKATSASLGTECPRWMQFLAEITDNDDEMMEYLARVAGYALTGSIEEHALFFCYGTGRNGKSKYVETISKIMGDYAHVAPMNMFLHSPHERHPTELAGLRGARLVTSGEIEKGARWDESKIKTLTGGDDIMARFMAQDFFRFSPQFTLLLMGNNKPSIRDVDVAMKARMHLIPFNVTIPEEKRDKKLSEKLWAERDGILGWMVQGCLDWQARGLRPPEAATEATEDYLVAEDAVGRWISERCREDRSSSCSTGALFSDWKSWAELSGEFIGNVRKLSDDLSKRGYKKFRNEKERGFYGISVGSAPAQQECPESWNDV